jgi:hypothetical protein
MRFNMRNIRLYATLAFASTSVLSGLFLHHAILEGVEAARIFEARWMLIIVMPVLLMTNYIWISSPPTKRKLDSALKIIGQTALWLAPYYWIFNHR